MSVLIRTVALQIVRKANKEVYRMKRQTDRQTDRQRERLVVWLVGWLVGGVGG